MSSIGILGGMGPQASNLLLSLLIESSHKFTTIQSDEDFPDIVLLNVPMPNFTQDTANQTRATEVLLSKLPILEQAQTTVNAIACNTVHLMLPEIQASTNLKFIHMPNLVINHAKKMRFKKVGLLGSQTTVDSDLYRPDTKELSVIKPNAGMQRKINHLIMAQIQGKISQDDRSQLKEIVERFIEDYTLDAVILGCTELPVILGEHPRCISSLHVLADSLLEEYFMGN